MTSHVPGILRLTVAGNSALFWATYSPVVWDPTGLWSFFLHDIDEILIILVHGKASRFCNIHTNLSTGLFRSVLCAEYGCAVLLTVMLLMRTWGIRIIFYYIKTDSWILLRSMNLVPSLASLLISTVAWRHSKADGSGSASVSFQSQSISLSNS